MKVVLFCGGLGLQLSPTMERVPKPLVNIGDKPILFQLMKYYAFYGHKDFILCLGYKGDQIKKYFLNYDEYLFSDFVLSRGRDRRLISHAMADWKITFVDTGLNSSVGQRLRTVEPYLDGEEHFLANYSDAVTDLPLPDLIDFHIKHNKIATMITVQPLQSYHAVTFDSQGVVTQITPLHSTGLRVNGGFFVFKHEIFDYIKEGGDLINGPFKNLITAKELVSYEYNGFWKTMDTYKDKQEFDDMESTGKHPWRVWP